VWLRPPGLGFPRVEHLLVAAPAGVVAKQRPGFEHVWSQLSDMDSVHAGADGEGEPSLCGIG